MKKTTLMAALAMAIPAAANAAEAPATGYDFTHNWPTHYVFDDGTDLGLALKYQYDVDRFSNDNGRLPDAQTNRRKEFGFYVTKKGVYDATVVYDFQAKTWLDTYLRVQSKGLFGHDVGAFRIGFSKTPVGFEGNTSTGATTFLEAALPTQAVYASRRIGADWAWERPHYLVNLGYYSGGDLNGDSDGRMAAARVAWVPRNQAGDVLHLGLAASREWPDGTTDGRGIYTPPTARLRARPEAGLAARLVDTGNLAPVDHIDRSGLETLWIGGPWSLQGEYLRAHVSLHGRPAYAADGYYLFASWVATGESRPYAAGNVGSIKPKGAWGALEFALRYSELNLDDGVVQGGRERDWTLGANWYINRYLKLQANYVHAQSDRRGRVVDPNVVEVRAQIQF
ncbi:OprO/OprP family phosphate-selective porin [Dyella sp.]|uniref:OprO/OprP family phosphate-selective porin n=1 Tax=Dyella sp. TaxID=1869338 RepID=UPI003F7D6A55